MASISSVITGGFGVPGSASLVITDGYGTAGAVVPPVVVSSAVHGGGGFRREGWKPKRKSLAEIVDLSVQEVVAELRKAAEPVVEQMQAIVEPHVSKPTKRSRPRIDYEALQRDLGAVRELVALLEQERAKRDDEDEEEELALYAAL